MPGKYSCRISDIRSLRPGDTVTVSATLREPKPGAKRDEWEGIEVASVLVDGGAWQAEVPVVIDGKPASGAGLVTMKQTDLDTYEGCAEVGVGPGAALPLSCRITATGLFSGRYACSITTPENLAPGQTVTVCAMLQEPGCHGQRPSDESTEVAMLSIEGGAWQTEIPVVVDAADWSSIVTGNGSLVFVPNRDELKLRLRQTSIRDYEACLDFEVWTRADMRLSYSVSAFGTSSSQYRCTLVDTDLEAPGGTATLCTELKMRADRRRIPFPGAMPTGYHPEARLLKGARMATVSVYGMPAHSDVSVEFSPSRLDLTDGEGSVTCHVELPEGYGPDDVDATRLMLNETLSAQLRSKRTGDYDGDGRPDLTIEFARGALVKQLASQSNEAPEVLELVVTGELTDGTPFRGAGTVLVVRSADGS
jgi:hypothetical protein